MMPTKVTELELSKNIAPIRVSSEYDNIAILVRFYKKPLGWVRIGLTGQGNLTVSKEELQQQIKNQLGVELIQSLILNNLGCELLADEIFEPISIVVCTRDRTAQLENCLRSIFALNYPNYEVIVIDNAPNTDETEKLTTNFPVRYVREDCSGIAWARNRGVAEARYKIIAFTDDDVQVDEMWLSQIAQSFVNQDVMAVTGFVAPAELETSAQLLFEFDYGGMSHGFHQHVFNRNNLTERDMLWSCSFGVTANAAFRRQIFDDVGLFDVALRPNIGGEDIELFHRMITKGHTIVYEPSALVWHAHRRHLSALHRQIFNNCRSFGCYLLTCYHKRSLKRSSILRFIFYEWLCKWILARLIQPNKVPRYIVLIELFGFLSSPLAFREIRNLGSKML